MHKHHLLLWTLALVGFAFLPWAAILFPLAAAPALLQSPLVLLAILLALLPVPSMACGLMATIAGCLARGQERVLADPGGHPFHQGDPRRTMGELLAAAAAKLAFVLGRSPEGNVLGPKLAGDKVRFARHYVASPHYQAGASG